MTSISAERSGLASVGMTLRRREQWGARRSYTDARTVSEPATKQFVHITVTNPGNYSSFDRHAQAIEAIGISRFPNTGISYNRLFMAGTRNVYEAQPIGRRGAHTVNDFRRSTCSLSGCPSRGTSLAAPSWNLNYNARAYAYASDVGFSVPDHVIDDMARSMAADRLAGFVTRNATIHGHRCVSAKSCPGDRMWDRMHDLERRVEHYLEDDDMPAPKDWDDKDWYVFRNRLLMADLARDSGNGAQMTPWAQDRWPDHLSTTVAGLLGYVAVNSRDAAGAVRSPVRWEDGEDRSIVHTLSWLQRGLSAVMEAQQGSDAPAILAKLDEVAAADAARDQAVLDLLEQVGSGNLTAEEFVDEIARRLSAAPTD